VLLATIHLVFIIKTGMLKQFKNLFQQPDDYQDDADNQRNVDEAAQAPYCYTQ
jgi:hypothetical protein